MIIGVPKEIFGDENRVALIPESVGQLIKKGNQVLVEAGAGLNSAFLDEAYVGVGATIVPDAAALFRQSELVCKVQRPLMNDNLGKHEINLMRPGTVLVTFFQPLVNHDIVRMLVEAKITSLSMDAIPRTTRAQAMDALSSMSSIAGYKAVLIGATALGTFYPLLTTAAGTVRPSKVLVLGAGVAGLMAIAIARKLGAVVEAFDVRPVVKEQVESLGAKFLEVELKEETQTAGGYAKQLSEESQRLTQELIHRHAKEADVIITTALIPGRAAPVLVTAAMVQDMKPGSVIVDLAAENGGNCELTEPGCDFLRHNVRILGPLNIPSTMPIHASQLYSRNMTNLLNLLVKDGKLNLDFNDDIIAGTCITHDGNIVNAQVKAAVEPTLERSTA
ncbi:MAG TPA: Re/Si-specific NAD(P)(+) transhydrogenase subunit alpha [Chloroflexia bacterium]|nr:Re/Si-specific NAD(P)(+) transhydrogenase subunit alpha [Chloroflexia bacterium]